MDVLRFFGAGLDERFFGALLARFLGAVLARFLVAFRGALLARLLVVFFFAPFEGADELLFLAFFTDLVGVPPCEEADLRGVLLAPFFVGCFVAIASPEAGTLYESMQVATSADLSPG